jgi:hypothetical protein
VRSLFLGGYAMCNLAKVLSIVMVTLAAGNVFAAVPPAPPAPVPPPFVKVSAPEGPMDLGYIWASGAYQAGAQVNVRVVANCPYQIGASLRELKHKGGKGSLPPKQTTVSINGKVTALGGRVVVAKSQVPTPPQGEDVSVGVQVSVKNLMQCPAGQYGGTLVITVMATP